MYGERAAAQEALAMLSCSAGQSASREASCSHQLRGWASGTEGGRCWSESLRGFPFTNASTLCSSNKKHICGKRSNPSIPSFRLTVGSREMSHCSPTCTSSNRESDGVDSFYAAFSHATIPAAENPLNWRHISLQEEGRAFERQTPNRNENPRLKLTVR